MSMNTGSNPGSSTHQRQLNIRSLYPQVKASTTPISFEAGVVSQVPLISFDHHYSSDEEMTSSHLKKPQYPSCGKKSMLSKIAVLPATTASRKEPATTPKISEVVIEGSQREVAKLRDDEGATALKRRKVDNNCDAVNTQTSVRTADTMSDLKISPQSLEMSQSMSEMTQPSQN